MNPYSKWTEICTCSHCHARLHYGYKQNVYNGGPWYCGNCGWDVTIDMYGKGRYGYYVQPVNGIAVHYDSLREASMIAEMFGAKLYYAHQFHYKPELVT